MTLEVRAPTADEWPEVCAFDGRSFGATYSADEIEQKRPIHDMTRFRMAVDRKQIVGVAGSYELDATVPGGRVLSMGGLTWVSVAVTHRRQGVMRRLVDEIHADIDARSEPLATLYASEGGIYDHVGYGVGTQLRVTNIDPRSTRLRDEFRPPSGAVRYVEGDEIVPTIEPLWSRFRLMRSGEVGATRSVHEYMVTDRQRPADGYSAAAYLVHRDGYAVYRTKMQWNDGHPAHAVSLIEFVSVTPDAHAALWHTLLSLDLVGSITSRIVPIDDPLPLMLENPRALRTTDLNDGVWLNVRDIPACFGARTYRSTERFVVDVDGVRWAIDGGPDGASCTKVRSKPDLVTSHGSFSSLLYGGVLPSGLAAGGRLRASDKSVLARADVFFTTSLAPHCQTGY